jgi:polar amino acid transport system substrate-binding protein
VTRRLGITAAIVLAAALLAGCGGGGDRAQRMTLAALSLQVRQASRVPASGPSPRCTNVTASLAPPAAMPAPGAMPAGSFMAQIQHRGYLIAGVDQNTLLFAYFNPLQDQVEGFEIDMLHELARAIFGNPDAVHFRAITTDERVQAVQDGGVDVVADAMTVTCERRQQVDFSTVYYDAGQRILVPSNSPVTSVSQLGGKPVCATVGSTSIKTLESLVPRPTPYPVAQRTDCLVALQQGLVDAITSDDSILLGFQAQDPYTKLVGPRFADEPYAMAISKAHPDFVAFINGVLAQMRADGTWRAIYARWLGRVARSVPAPPAPVYGSLR